MATFDLDLGAAAVLTELFEAQAQWSEVPDASGLLVEESPAPDGDGWIYTFHAPLHRAACEALGGQRRPGWDGDSAATWRCPSPTWAGRSGSTATPRPTGSSSPTIGPLLDPEGFAADVLEGLDRGELPARRFQQVAATGLMVLAQQRAGPARAGRRHELGQHAAVPAGEGRLPRPPPAPRNPPRGARRLARCSGRRALAQRATGDSIPIVARPIAVRRRLDRAGPGRFAPIRAAR